MHPDINIYVNVVLVILLVVLLWQFTKLVLDIAHPECDSALQSQQSQQSQQPTKPSLTIPNNCGVTVFNPDVTRPRTPGLTTGADGLPDQDKPSEEQAIKLDISDIPFSNKGCIDQFNSCPQWSNNGECEINPEFMLENCPYSCNRCGLTREQKNRVIQYHLSTPAKKCLSHGEYDTTYYNIFSAAHDAIL